MSLTILTAHRRNPIKLKCQRSALQVSTDDAVTIDFSGCSTIYSHKVKINHEYKISVVAVYFEVREQVYSNRPGYRDNSVSLTWYDQIGDNKNCSLARFHTQSYAPKDSRISPGLEDVKIHLGKTFKVIEK